MSGHAGTWLGTYLVNSVWQGVVLAAMAALAARFARRLGNAWQHRLWIAALVASAVLPAVQFGFPELISFWRPGAGGGGLVRTAFGPSTAVSGHVLSLAPWLAKGLLACWLGCVLFRLARLVRGLAEVRALVRRALPLSAEQAALVSALSGAALPPAQVSRVAGLAGPMVAGCVRARLLLPEGFLEQTSRQDCAAALAHELAHVRRRDYAKNLLYSLMTLPVAYHPCVWLLRARVTESREMVCDAMAGEALHDATGYARALLRLAVERPPALGGAAGQAVGIFDGRSLERRITNMMHTRTQLKGLARAAAIGALLLFAAGTGMATASARLDVHASPSARPVAIQVKGSVMEGNIISKQPPVYPAEAKARHEQGTVALAVVINKQGAVEQLKVVHSAGKALDRSALDAVHKWQYKPYLLNGEPIAVGTTINITYSLGK